MCNFNNLQHHHRYLLLDKPEHIHTQAYIYNFIPHTDLVHTLKNNNIKKSYIKISSKITFIQQTKYYINTR